MVKEANSRVTLELIARVATLFFRIRGALILVGVAGAIWLAIAIADPSAASAQALLALSLILWSAVALGIAYTLPLLPPPIVPADRFWRRTKKRLLVFGYGAAVVGALGLGVVALLMTLRAVAFAAG